MSLFDCVPARRLNEILTNAFVKLTVFGIDGPSTSCCSLTSSVLSCWRKWTTEDYYSRLPLEVVTIWDLHQKRDQPFYPLLVESDPSVFEVDMTGLLTRTVRQE